MIELRICQVPYCDALATWELFTHYTYNAMCDGHVPSNLEEGWELRYHPEGILQTDGFTVPRERI